MRTSWLAHARPHCSMVFDLVNYSILLKKMERYGVRGSGFEITLLAEWTDVKMDVPLGSIFVCFYNYAVLTTYLNQLSNAK